MLLNPQHVPSELKWRRYSSIRRGGEIFCKLIM